MKKDDILGAMRKPTVSGGYVFSQNGAVAAQPRDICAYYDACMRLDENPMTQAIRTVLLSHLEGRDQGGRAITLFHLKEAVEEVPVLSIRKYAYEHGLAFFFRELALSEEEFDEWCEVIAQLVKTYKLIHFQAVKLAMSHEPALAQRILDLLDEQDRREFSIKSRLHEVYLKWRSRTMSDLPSLVATGAVS